MFRLKIITITLFSCCVFINISQTQAQLSQYIGYTKEKAEAAEKRLEKEASRVVTKKTVAYGDTFDYKIMTFKIRAFNDSLINIDLWEKPFDGHVLHIKGPTDSLISEDCSGLAKVHILGKDLLEIVYATRGGSDDGYDNVLILGYDKGKFCKVLEIMSLHLYDNVGLEGLYNLRIKLKGQSQENYSLDLNIRDLYETTIKNQKSYDRTYRYSLQYDKNQHIFYNGYKKLNTKLKIYRGINKLLKHQLKGSFPVINIFDYSYIYIDNNWYTISQDATQKSILLFNYTN